MKIYLVTDGAIAKYVTSKTKAVIVNSPNNPTVRVLTYVELESIARVAAKNDLWMLTDDISTVGLKTIAGLPNIRNEKTVDWR